MSTTGPRVGAYIPEYFREYINEWWHVADQAEKAAPGDAYAEGARDALAKVLALLDGGQS